MTSRTMSREGIDKLTKPWEEFVAYPYDDKRAKIHGPHGWQYPEWTGGPVIGTITIGWGHTNAAGAPRVVPGMRITEAEGEDILAHDLAPCDAMVNRALKVNVTQHVFDGLVDLTFNCPSALPHVAAYINANNKAGAERIMLQYVNSRGQYMVGLTHRRTAEIAWMNTPDSPDEAAATITSPKAEREPQPKTMGASTTGAAAVASGAAGTAVATLHAANDIGGALDEAKGHIMDLGLGHFLHYLQSPWVMVMLGMLIAGLAAYVYYERRQRLLNDHV